MKSLKPYGGGNDALWALHQLDILRKHRRLLNVDSRAATLSVRFKGAPGERYIPIAAYVGANGETALGFLPKAACNAQFQIAPFIVIQEAAFGTRPVIDALRIFIRLARGIIAKFDTP